MNIMVWFHFYSAQNVLISFLISSLSHVLSRSGLFSFQIFEDFPEMFLLLIGNLNSIIHILCDLNPFKFIETCFVA